MDPSAENTFTHNVGVTEAERYLQHLCKKTFLSLWSYPGLYKCAGKELCDLLVVFDNNIVIFSDKYCKFPDSGNLLKDWSRWFKRAVYKSARQAWGAERWIRQYPDKIFADRKASTPLPFVMPEPSKANIFLIVVAHDGAKRCAREFGGSGSFMLQSDLTDVQNYNKPFYIGDLDLSKTFVHILNDTSLNIILRKLDTISDFVAYLSKKEKLFRSELKVVATGEEELLAHYLTQINDEGMHDFVFPKNVHGVAFMEGEWEKFISSQEVKKQEEADRISYVWDRLIERFSYHALTGTQYHTTPPGIQSSEKVLRFLAKEPRIKRRMLAKAIIGLLKKTPANTKAISARYVGSKGTNDPGTTYVFLLLPKIESITDEEYREHRLVILQTYCQIVKIRFPNAQDIVGIATEPGIKNDVRSEDALYLDASKWTHEQQENAEKLFKNRGLQKDVQMNYYYENEYLDVVTNDPKKITTKLLKNPRNKPCPCGSGKKYKKCCMPRNA